MAKVISKQVLDDIRFRNDIAEVIGSYFNLQRAGSAFKAVCPFHKEKTPSFHVNPQRQIYHCFGCGAGGDVFGFIMQYEGVSFGMAAKMLADRANIQLEIEEDDQAGSDKNALFKILAEVANLYHTALTERSSASQARNYLKERDLAEETIKEFMIGYAPNRWDAVMAWGEKNKYSLDLMEKTGQIVVKTDDNGKRSGGYYDRFRNRLMFPISDEQGRIIGFSGRVLEKDEKGAKYVNTPETPLFQKGRVLYALDKARRHIVETREAIICEGQIDVIRCHQSGIKTAVAAQGTAFTEDHVRVIRRYADSVVIVFDSDTAGQDAAIRTAGLFMEAGLAVRVASLPDKEDPDSFIRKHGADAFREVVKNAESAVAFQIRVLSARENSKSEVGVMRIARSVLQTIGHSPNAVQKARLVQEAAQRLNLPASALEDDLQHMIRQSRSSGSRAAAQPTAGATDNVERLPEEVALCEHLTHITDFPELGPLVQQYLPLEKISDPACRLILKAALESQENGRSIQDVLRDYPQADEAVKRFAAQVQMEPCKIQGREFSRTDAVRDLILHIWKRELRKEREQLGPDARERHSQITYDLNRLRRWTDGAGIIEIEIEMSRQD